MKKLLPLFIFLYSYVLITAQNCPEKCKKTILNSTLDLTVNFNDVVCITGTYSGNINLHGGELYICGNAQIDKLSFTKSSILHLTKSAIISINTIVASNQNVVIENFSDSVVLGAGVLNTPIQISNTGTIYTAISTFNSDVQITNAGKLVFTNGLTLNGSTTINNAHFITVVGRLNMNKTNISINSACNFEVTQGVTLSGQTINISGGALVIRSGLNINSGKILLNDASQLVVDSMQINGYIEGFGGRSNIECVHPPNLKSQGAIRGNISLCIGGSFTPISGTVTAPAAVDCKNPIGPSPCYTAIFNRREEIFRLKFANAFNWESSINWEMFIDDVWENAPQGRYPDKKSTVTIDNGKRIVINSNVEVKSLTLGNNSTSGSIETLNIGSFEVATTDSLIFANINSKIKFANVKAEKYVVGTIHLTGSAQTVLTLDKINSNNIVLKMDNSSATSSILKSLEYDLGNGNINLLDTLKIASHITPVNGTLNTNNKLILLSDQNYSASILEGKGNYITGTVKVQDYIPAIARRYRFLSSPVSGTNLKDWQNEVFITGNNAAGNATGNTPGTLNSAGFDATSSNQPGIYFYDEMVTGNLNNGWIAITNESNTLTDIPLTPGKGYRVFIRGDRSDIGRLDGTNPTQNAVTMDLNGLVNTGDFSFPITYTDTSIRANDGWNMVGNPYPAAYDFAKFYDRENLNVGNLDPTIWIYNAKTNAYVSYNLRSNSGSLRDGIIPPGQCFWVKANGRNPKLKLTEKYKVADNGVDYRSVNMTNSDEIKFTLIKDSINSDQVIIKYMNGATKLKDSFDIEKFWSNIGIGTFGNDSIYLDLSCRPIDYNNTDFIPIYFYVDESGTYKLLIEHNLSGYTKGASLYLLDDYLQKYIDLRTNNSYDFNVDKTIPATENYNRFYLVFLPALPATSNIKYLLGERDKQNVMLYWATDQESFPLTMEVQRGYSIFDFETIGVVSGTGTINEGVGYNFMDTSATFAVPLYYRLVLSDSIYGSRPSTAISLDYTGSHEIIQDDAKKEVLVFPNPSSGLIQIMCKEPLQDVEIVDIHRREVMHVHTPENNNSINISKLDNGFYFMQATGISGDIYHGIIIKQ